MNKKGLLNELEALRAERDELAAKVQVLDKKLKAEQNKNKKSG